MVKTLYSIIGELGKDKIQRDITLNIEKSRLNRLNQFTSIMLKQF